MVFAKTSMPSALGFAFPDICNTVVGPAVVPIPYPNFSMGTMAIPSQFACYTECMPEHNLLTTTPITNGDEAGVSMGIASGTMIGPNRELLGSFKCFVGVAPATKMLSMTIQNSTNMVGMQLTPAQVKVMMLS